MNRNPLLNLLCCLLLAACTFDAPLAPDSGIPVDPALVGDWDILPAEGEESSGETVSVRQDGDSRYRIVHRDGDSIIYFVGWLGEIHGIPFLQLEVTGDESGQAEPGEPDLFSVIRFHFEGEDLVIHSLNTELVDPGLTDSDALQAAFAEHRDNPELFIEPGVLRRR